MGRFHFQRIPVRPLLLDGAIGTELIARGMRVRQECPEAWNLTRPTDVGAVHASYIAAGSDIIQTNTFGATRPRLRRFGKDGELLQIIRSAVDLARQAAHGRVVFGSLGPTGETLTLAPGADTGFVEQAFAESAAIFAALGVDAIHLETMFHPLELAAAIRGVRAGAPDVPLCASMTLVAGITGIETPHGVPLDRMLRAALDQAQPPDALGVNCSVDGERMLRAVTALAEASPLPILAKPQAKISEKCASGVSSETPEAFARRAAGLVNAGAALIGGCCGVGPRSIAALRQTLDAGAPAPAELAAESATATPRGCC